MVRLPAPEHDGMDDCALPPALATVGDARRFFIELKSSPALSCAGDAACTSIAAAANSSCLRLPVAAGDGMGCRTQDSEALRKRRSALGRAKLRKASSKGFVEYFYKPLVETS